MKMLLAACALLLPAAARAETPKTRLLLLSNTQNEGLGTLDHAMPAIKARLGGVDHVLLVLYASKDRAAGVEKFRKRFAVEGVAVDELTPDAKGLEALAKARAVYVGGGNTYRLLKSLQDAGQLEPLRRRVREGVPYVGASAGSVLAAPTIMTTNDMPIVSVAGFKALGLVPFQINVHFFDPIPGMPGETREERLFEFLEENDAPILAMRQGGWLVVDGDAGALGGAGARLFRPGDKRFDKARPDENKPREFAPGASLGEALRAR